MTPDEQKQADYRLHRLAHGRAYEDMAGAPQTKRRAGRARSYREIEDDEKDA